MVVKHLMSRKILSLLLDDFSFFGSLPFFLFVIIWSYYIGDITLFYRLCFGLAVSLLAVLIIKLFHHKDRPEKIEHNVFIEKVVASSFPSTHSMFASVIAVLLIVSYPFRWFSIAMVGLAFFVFVQRVITKKHFTSDIIGGVLIAIVVAYTSILIF